MNKPIKLILTVFLLSFCFVSCDKDDEPANQHELVGTWTLSENFNEYGDVFVVTTKLTFNSDFSGIFNYSYTGIDEPDDFERFTWSAEDGYISIDFTFDEVNTPVFNSDDTEGYYGIDGDELTLSLEYEGTGIFDDVVYTRVQ